MGDLRLRQTPPIWGDKDRLRALEAVAGANAIGLIQVAVVKVGKIDREVADIEPPTGGESPNVKPETTKDHLFIAQLPPIVVVKGDRAAPVLGGIFQVFKLDIATGQKAAGEIGIGVRDHYPRLDGGVD